MAIVEYEHGSRFPGTIGRTVEESSTAWPAPRRAREGAPNVLFVVLDDVGYGQLSCFGDDAPAAGAAVMAAIWPPSQGVST